MKRRGARYEEKCKKSLFPVPCGLPDGPRSFADGEFLSGTGAGDHSGRSVAWYEETYGRKVKVEYSTFGTNEDLYNMLTLGDVYDLVCPSEYMFMKLMAEDMLVPLSDHFYDTSDPNNYYAIGVSPYIKGIFDAKTIGGEPWSKYAAGYMWGVTGIVYNPDVVTEEEASTWKILNNSKFKRQVTIKDNVRDSYFAAVGAIKSDLLTSPEFLNDPDYSLRLEEEMNDVSPETIQAVQDYLQTVKNNVYSFETDSGKASGRATVPILWTRRMKMTLPWRSRYLWNPPIFISTAGSCSSPACPRIRPSSTRRKPLSTSIPGRTM